MRRAVGQARGALESARRRAIAVALVAASLAATLLALGALAPVAVARTASAGEEALPSGLLAAAPPPAGKTGSRVLQAREAAAAEGGISLTPSSTRPYYVCPEGTCQAIVDPQPVSRTVHGKRRLALPDGTPLQGSGEKGGLTRRICSRRTTSRPRAEPARRSRSSTPTAIRKPNSDLGVYRERYGLAPCTSANGCFSKVNQKGEEADYPSSKKAGTASRRSTSRWSRRPVPNATSCSSRPTCRRHRSPRSRRHRGAARRDRDLQQLGVPEQSCGASLCEEVAADFDHPGVMITAGSGDSGYENSGEDADSPSWPASLPDVVAVGGTALHRAANARGWSEETWSLSAGGGSVQRSQSRDGRPTQTAPGA